MKAIRTAEVAMGTSELGPTASESLGRDNFRLSCLSTADIATGTPIQRQHIAYRRPGTGIPPKQVEAILGLTLKRDVVCGHVFTWEDFK